MISNFTAIGIQPKNNGNQQKVVCPNCVKMGKTNLRDTCLSINLTDGVYNCHKCGWSGCVAEREYKKEFVQPVYKIPAKPNRTDLTKEALEYMQSRGISQNVLNANSIKSTADGSGIIFPYFDNGKLINYKTRLLKEKRFFQAKEAKPIIYNYDRIKDKKEIIIVEGEIDGLSWEVAGFEFHTSVNQGAPNENDANVYKKLECITNCFDVFEKAETVYVAVDNDPNGLRLQKELIRRIGAEKCKIVDYRDCKDANEYLLKHGAYELAQLLKFAKDVKIEGVFTLQDNFDSMLNSFRVGQKRGETTYCPEIDKAWKWRTSEVNLWTGYQNEGKSLMLNQLALIRAYWTGEKFAVFSPENMPMDDFYNDLIEMYIGKTSDPHYQMAQMSEAEYLEAASFVDKHFFLIYPEDDFKIDTIFDKAQYLVRKQGVRHLIIDPYNTVEHLMRAGEREDLYISRFMSRLKKFAVANDVSVHLVAHQLTARKNKDDGGRYFKPDLNNIKGGGTFADKADNVLFVWRPERALDFRASRVIFASQKIKKQKLVARPCEVDCIDFEFKQNRYMFNGVSPLSKIDEHRKAPKTQQEFLQEVAPLPLVSVEDAFGNNYKEHDELPF